jgi:trimeric autotransporter adhesin
MERRLAYALIIPALLLLTARVLHAQDIITTVAGGGPQDVPALTANLLPSAVAIDEDGSVYIVSERLHRVFKVYPTGHLTVLAGAGALGSSQGAFGGDGGPAVHALLNLPTGLALDPSGQVLYIADSGNRRIRVVDLETGTITTVAGTGQEPRSVPPDGVAATQASFDRPTRVAVSGSGDLFILDAGARQLRRVDAATGTIMTIAGAFNVFGHGGDGGPAAAATFMTPTGMAVNSHGDIFVADADAQRVRRIDAASGVIATVAGTGVPGFSGDGGPAAAAALSEPGDLAVDAAGHLFVTDDQNNRVRRIDPAGVITTIAGGGLALPGDGGPAVAARFLQPTGVGVDGDGHLFVASHGRVQRVDAATNAIATVAGTGVMRGLPFTGLGWQATAVMLEPPRAVAVDPWGHLYFGDHMPELGEHEGIYRVDAETGVLTLVAAGNAFGVWGLATDAAGNLFFSRSPGVWRVDAISGVITMVAGATCAGAMAMDRDGHIYFADRCENDVRRIEAGSGSVTVVAGTGNFGVDGDGGLATDASLMEPEGVAVDAAGHLYIADALRIRRVDANTGVITTVTASLSFPRGLAADAAGNLFVSSGHQVLRIDAATGGIATVAGTGSPGFAGEGGWAALAGLNSPRGLAVDGDGALWIADALNRRVRKVTPSNRPPTADAGPDQPAVECTHAGCALVALDGAASSDPDGDPLTYTWTGPFLEGDGVATGVSPTVTLPIGTHAVTLTVEDSSGATDTDAVGITVVDTQSPLLTLLRAEVEVEPTSATGAVVDVLAASGASAADLCDSDPVLEHDGPEEFPIGTTVVTIVARDASGNAVDETFAVRVLSAAEVTEATIATVHSYDLDPGMTTALTAPLEGVLAELNDAGAGTENVAFGTMTLQEAETTTTTTMSSGRTRPRNQLHAFVQLVAAQRGKSLTEPQADELSRRAQVILQLL